MFVGRKAELKLIREIMSRPKSKIIAINGRRRVGKSTLALKIGEGKRFFHFSGLSPNECSTARGQLNNFSRLLSIQLEKPVEKFSDWSYALNYLSAHINPHEYTVILFDEMSWMSIGDKTFVSKLKVWWDTDISLRENVLLIFCGSVSTWIEKNIINSTAFYGRISAIINLSQLSIPESAEMLHKIGFKGSAFELYAILSITGGIPWYLEQINPALNVDQNIKSLCFLKNGILFSEFDKIFNDLFSKGGDIYKKILDSLSDGMKTLIDIRKDVSYLHGGAFSDLLNNLSICGFVSKHSQWSFKTGYIGKRSVYMICDPYVRFYLKYIKPNENLIQNNRFEKGGLKLLSSYNNFIGFQMESLLLQNRNRLLELMEIENPLMDNPYIQKPTAVKRGCQIDYLVQTRTNTLYVCEFKFHVGGIGTEIIDEMRQKIKRLSVPRGMAIVPVLFHMGEVNSPVYESNFFYKIIDLADLLEE
ncbi:MAG: ATP-binding protein [Holosporaceae bacterium]|jgi:AAA+ ATPase superfamily predicted ATPase|nr:ATP-binding protein [Holosporaceae bacterium]